MNAAARTAFLLGLTCAGFLAAIVVTGESYYWPVMCWTLAAIYALATNPRRWL